MAFLSPVATRLVRAQAPISREEAIYKYTSIQFEGFSSIPRAERDRVLADSATLDYFDDMLNGRVPWPRVSDTTMVLDWLAISDRPRYLPTLLRYADASASGRVRLANFQAAVPGLTRLAALPEAKQRLIELGAPRVPRELRESLAFILSHWNSIPARDALRQVTVADLHPKLQADVRAALDAPPDH